MRIAAILLLGPALNASYKAILPTATGLPTPPASGVDQWTRAAGVSEGKIFRAVARKGKVWGGG